VFGAALALLGYYAGRWITDTESRHLLLAQAAVPVDTKRLWAYAVPLTPLSFVGWVSGQSDRYILAAAAGLAPAGLYAALYGLASRPFMMVAGGFELALRQVYYGHVSKGDRSAECRVFRLWLAAVLGASLFLLLVIALFHRPIAWLLLAEEYRTHSHLMFWIAAGHLLAACTQVVERVCYAKNDTRGVLLIQAAGAGLSVVVVVPLSYVYGIYGAAWAVPIYFGLQLALAVWRALWAQSLHSSD
jgi:O-antigen/teichoic acid export membrane protein